MAADSAAYGRAFASRGHVPALQVARARSRTAHTHTQFTGWLVARTAVRGGASRPTEGHAHPSPGPPHPLAVVRWPFRCRFGTFRGAVSVWGETRIRILSRFGSGVFWFDWVGRWTLFGVWMLDFPSGDRGCCFFASF